MHVQSWATLLLNVQLTLVFNVERGVMLAGILEFVWTGKIVKEVVCIKLLRTLLQWSLWYL